MSIVHEESVGSGVAAEPEVVPTGHLPRRYHRLATVRSEQGVSLRSVARQMETTISEVRAQEDETTDLRLSDLIRWQKVLNVPLQDLLVDPEPPLSRPVMERARLIRLMKTASAIKENVKSVGALRLATMLVEQLVEIMPELADVSAWHSVGQRRSLDEYGRAVERRIADDLFFHRGEY